MNRATFPEMLQCVNPSGPYCPNMAVLERQRASIKLQHQQQGIYENFFRSGMNDGGAFCMTSQGLVVTDVTNNNPVKLHPGVYNDWPDLRGGCGLGGDMGLLVATEEKVMADQKSGQVGNESLRKRKTEDENEEKKLKGLCTEETGSKPTVQSNSKEIVSNSQVQKQDYIHVRARRGQATDSHSLAERVRREKISERMKFLQDLVPGCNKITGKAGMLDEIINYVQSLQHQVEFLSMKLAGVNPRLDMDIESLFTKEISPACTPSFATFEAGSSELTNQGYLHFNPATQVISCVGMELGVNSDPGLCRTISAPLPVTQTQVQSATWDDIRLQNPYNIEFQQGRAMAFPSHHQFTGSLEAGNMKLEM